MELGSCKGFKQMASLAFNVFSVHCVCHILLVANILDLKQKLLGEAL